MNHTNQEDNRSAPVPQQDQQVEDADRSIVRVVLSGKTQREPGAKALLAFLDTNQPEMLEEVRIVARAPIATIRLAVVRIRSTACASC